MPNNKPKLITYISLLAIVIIGFVFVAVLGIRLGQPSDGWVSKTPSATQNHNDGENDAFATSNPLDMLGGAKFGILYYNLGQFGMAEMDLKRDDEEEEALLKLFLKCTNFTVTDVSIDEMTATVEFTYPVLDSIIPDVLRQISENSPLDVLNILDMAFDTINNDLPQFSQLASTNRKFKIIEDASGGYKFGATTIESGFIDAVFTIPYLRYMNFDYVLSIINTSSEKLYGVSSVYEIPSTAIYPDAHIPSNNSILITECDITLPNSSDPYYTKPITFDMDNDGVDETIWINSQYGIIIFEGELPRASTMPPEWRNACESDDCKDLFEHMIPMHLTVIDSDIQDGCIEIIVCMKSARTDIIEGSYYVFSYGSGNQLHSKKLMDYGQARQYLGLAVKGNHLAIEVFVNIMGFRYMQFNAKLDTEKLELDLYSDGNLLYKHTIDPITNNGMFFFINIRAVLAVPLECYTVDDTGAAAERVTLPVGTVLTPVRASSELAFGGLMNVKPVYIGEDSTYPTAEDYAERLRKGMIMFRDEKGNAYMVNVEITASPGIELINSNIGDYFTEDYYYPESIYIGGIEQNILFKDLNYLSYYDYMVLNNMYQ